MSHLDSQKSYRDLVIGKANEGQPPQKENSGALGQDASGSGHPMRENVISNMRGRSIVSGSREVLTLKNSNNALKKEDKAMGDSPSQNDVGSLAPITSGTDNDQSMHRITNLNRQQLQQQDFDKKIDSNVTTQEAASGLDIPK